jgi:hypothetical protein
VSTGSRMTAPARQARWSVRRALGAGAALLAVLAVCVRLVEGTPHRLPGIALGSAVLLHGERALALVAVAIGALSMLAQAARGRLPIELSTSGVRYEAEAADDAAAAVAQLQEQLDELVAIVDALADRLDARQRHP